VADQDHHLRVILTTQNPGATAVKKKPRQASKAGKAKD